MDFLLHYTEQGKFDYRWFKTEKELRGFIASRKIVVYDSIEITQFRNIYISDKEED